MIEQIEELSTEVKPQALPVRQKEMLYGREVGIYEIRAVERGAACIAKLAGRGWDKATGVEPLN